MAQRFEKLERSIGYQFRDQKLLRQALTPPSAGLPMDNQRLEFFGDSVLHLCATRLVYGSHEDWDEGDLSKLRGKIVSTDSLHAWGIGLGIVLEHGPRTPKNRKTSHHKEMADAVEALLAAVVLDAEACGEDGFSHAYKIVEARFGQTILAASLNDWEQDDPKTALQERAVTMGLAAPKYELLRKAGPEHAPVFSYRVQVAGLEADASGTSVKRAQMEAARRLLAMIRPLSYLFI